MDFTYLTLSTSDPFRCLETDLDDVSEVLRDLQQPATHRRGGASVVDTGLEHMDTSEMNVNVPQPGPTTTPPAGYLHPSVVAHSSFFHHHSPFSPSTSTLYSHNTSSASSAAAGPASSFPPYSHHSPLLQHQQDPFLSSVQPPPPPLRTQPMAIQPVHDPYNSLKFSPPEFSSLSTNDFDHELAPPSSRVLAQLHSSSKNNYYGESTSSLELRSPYGGSAAGEDAPATAREVENARSTKEDLLRLLVSLTPAEVEKLREGVEDQRGRPTPVIASTARARTSTLPSARPAGVATRVPQLSKSATLRRAIEYIEELESRTRELSESLRSLQQLCGQHGIEVPAYNLASPTETKIVISECGSSLLTNDQQPRPSMHSPSDSASSPHASTNSSMTSPVVSPSPQQPRKKRSRLMMDQGRVSLCAMMFALLIWNPLASLISPTKDHDFAMQNGIDSLGSRFPGSRTLQAYGDDFSSLDSDWWQERVIRPAFVWSINICMVICVLTRLLVYGEPVHDFKSHTSSAFMAARNLAAAAFEAENRKEAHRQLVECLQILERPLPYTKFEQAMAVTWQVIRHVLNSMWIGRWFARRRRDELKPVPVVCRSHAHTALIYHQLNQLEMLGVHEWEDALSSSPSSFSSRLLGLHLALCAVNLAESAGAGVDGLSRASLAHIYIGAALRCRLSLPAFLAPALTAYFFRRAKRHIQRADRDSVSPLQFLFHPLTRRFISDPIRLRSALETHDPAAGYPFSMAAANGIAIDRVRQALKPHLLARVLAALRSPAPASAAACMDTVDATQLLLKICTANKHSSCFSNTADAMAAHGESSVAGDEVCTWWTHILACGMRLREARDDLAANHYSIIRNVAQVMVHNDLVLGVGFALSARRFMSDVSGKNGANARALIRKLTRLALSSLRVPLHARPQPLALIQENMLLLALEWTLSSLLAAWRAELDPAKPYWTQNIDSSYRDLYEEALHLMQFTLQKQKMRKEKRATSVVSISSLQEVAEKNTELLMQNQMKAFSLVARMMNGANAVETYTELLRLQRAIQVRYTQLACLEHCQSDATPLAYHLHVLTKFHLALGGGGRID